MVILITGISSGFGYETAKALSLKGHCVYGTVRKEVEKLPGVHYLQVDVRDRNAVFVAVNQIIAEQGRLDALVNNAGIGIGGPAEFASEEDIRAITETTFYGFVNCVQAAVPHMRRQKSGRIVMLSSIGGLMGLPFQSFYSAGKFAIEGFSEALRIELRSSGISVTMINPGDCRTGFTASRKKTVVADDVAEAYPSYGKSMQSIESDEMNGLKPTAVADAIVSVLESKRPPLRKIVASPVQKLSVAVKAMLPARWFSVILGKYYKL